MTHTKEQSKATTGPVCFGPDNDLFGWLHVPQKRSQRPAIVICNPVGFEFIRSHRSLRTLAEQLAASGYCVLRFDYRSTGDSAGDEFDESRIEAMLDSVRHAMDTVIGFAATQRVALVGLRLGATLVGKIAEERQLEQLVLWAPCESGAIYVREQQIMAAAQNKRLQDSMRARNAIVGIDAGGFLLTRDTQDELASLKLGDKPFKATPPALLLNRDDIRVAPRLADELRKNGSRVDVMASKDFRHMMMPPQFSRIPVQAIDSLCNWLEEQNRDARSNGPSDHDSPEPPSNVRLQLGKGIEERAVCFGPDNRLFGIVTSGPLTNDRSTPAVIMLCGGATHRISANRMYVTLARQLAANGTPVMRMDLAGLGDSLPHAGYPANKPYTDRLADDVEAAMDVLESITGRDRFLLFGLCSGAYAAMQTARRSTRVTDLVLVNQLVYYATPQDLADLASGAIASARDLDFPRSNSLIYRVITKLLQRVSRHWGWPGERLSPYVIGGPLPRDLEKLAGRGIRLAFVHSSRDAAIDALMITSGKRVRHLADSGLATIKTFDGTDHTFSPAASQQELSDWMIEYLQKRANT